jgi:NADPH2:quinone reductase
MKAIRIHRHGGPEVLQMEEVATGEPGPGEVRIRNRAIGLNFTDVYFRIGEYAPPRLPFIPGNEGAGEVIAVGQGVTDLTPGDRVGYVSLLGAYAEEHIVPARQVVKLPDAIDFTTGAAMMLKGLTAQYLLRRTFRVDAGQTVLIHAAAGGVGLILTQWARHLGATVIGTVGSLAKAVLARDHGADHVIDYSREDVAARVKEITKGEGVDVVYDSIGQATFAGSLDSLRRRGTFVSFGSASGPVPPFDITLLAKKGSLHATWPVLFDYITTREEMLTMTQELFDVVASGAVRVPVHAKLALDAAPEAHRRLEARETTGATVLLP